MRFFAAGLLNMLDVPMRLFAMLRSRPMWLLIVRHRPMRVLAMGLLAMLRVPVWLLAMEWSRPMWLLVVGHRPVRAFALGLLAMLRVPMLLPHRHRDRSSRDEHGRRENQENPRGCGGKHDDGGGG